LLQLLDDLKELPTRPVELTSPVIRRLQDLRENRTRSFVALQIILEDVLPGIFR